MSSILHMSDLHFGTEAPGLADWVLNRAAVLKPGATVISGDLTQRARKGQFTAARSFADRLAGPVLVVPGNHDMPLYNLPMRFLAPCHGYARHFGRVLESGLTLPDAVIQGVNTANPLAWKAGRLRQASTDRLTSAFAKAPAGSWRVAVMHHAPVPAADGTPADMADSAETLGRLAATGAQIVLSGHTHMPHWGMVERQAGMLFLQVGTAISTRRKTEANDFSLLELDPAGVTIRSWLALPGQSFAEGPASRFDHDGSAWHRVGDRAGQG